MGIEVHWLLLGYSKDYETKHIHNAQKCSKCQRNELDDHLAEIILFWINKQVIATPILAFIFHMQPG